MAVLAAIQDVDDELGSFVSVATEDDVVRQAGVADAHLEHFGEAALRERPLLGVPIAVKDLIQTEGLATSRGSLLKNLRSPVDAPAVARLRAAGAIIVGKTATSEYGWSASTVTRLGPPTVNPWNRSRSAGGSSGGSAAAVSARLCTAALGTDGAGSIRIPAAFCGIVGFKPSFGALPYVPPCFDRLAHLGPMAATVADVRALAEVMAGYHPDDPDSGVGWRLSSTRPASYRVGWLEFPETSPDVRCVSEAVIPVLEACGHGVERIVIPFQDPYNALVDILATAEAASVTKSDEKWGDHGRLAVARHGQSISGPAVMHAEQTRLALRTTMATVMESYDVLAMATVPIEPFDHDAIGPNWAADPEDLKWLAWSPASYPFNMTGQPALSLPAGLSSAGLPVGVQLVGPIGGDDLVLALAEEVERALGPLSAPPGLSTEGLV